MALGINGNHRLAIFEQDGRGMAEVLAGLTIDDYPANLLASEIDRGDTVTSRQIWLVGPAGNSAHGNPEQYCGADDDFHQAISSSGVTVPVLAWKVSLP